MGDRSVQGALLLSGLEFALNERFSVSAKNYTQKG